MSEFLQGQMDFIFFVYGLSFLILAVVCYYLQRNAQQILPWQWLGWFGLTHGMNEWLDLIALSYGDSVVQLACRSLLMAVSFVLLAEFGRQGIIRVYGKGPGRWSLAVLVIAAISGSSYGWSGFNASSRYALGLTGAWAAALPLWGLAGSPTAPFRPWLRTGSVCLLLYGVATGIIVSPAPFFPASLVNTATFLHVTGLPIQLLRSFLALGVAAMAVVILSTQLTDYAAISRHRTRFIGGIGATLIAILCVGWGLTQFLGNVSRANLIADGVDNLRLLTENFSQIFQEANRLAKNLAGSPEIGQTLMSEDASLLQKANATLDRYKENFRLSVCFLQDVHGTTIASSNRADPDSFVGHSFAFRPYFQQALKGSWGHYVALGAVTQKRAYMVSYPVRDSAQKIIGVVVLRLSLSDLDDKMILLHGRKHPAMITDANGVVILSNRPRLIFQTLWPVSPEVLSLISPQYKLQQVGAIFSKPLANGVDLWFEGNHYLLSYKGLPGDSPAGWTVVDISPYDEVSTYRLAGILITLIFMVLALASFLRHLSAKGRTAAIERQVAERTAALEIEIEERQRAEEISKLNEMRLETLVKLNHIANAPFPEIIAFAMEEAIRLTGSTIGYLSFMNEDETELTMHAWAQNDQQECLLINRPLTHAVESPGFWSTAVRQRQAIITNDDAAPTPWEKGFSEGNVAVTRHMDVPIIDGEKIVIVAGVGNKASDYDESDVRQLTLLMETMWRIIRRNRVEEALRESERNYRLMLNNVPAVVFRGYMDWSVDCFDPKMEVLTGYTKEEFASRRVKWCDVIHPDDLAYATRVFIEAIKTTRSYVREHRIVTKVGDIKWVQCRGQIACDAAGQVEHISGMTFDITDRKKLEEERSKYSKLESLGLLAGGIAHDFNNILTAILGNISLAMMEVSPGDSQHERLLRADHACQQARGLAQQLLTFAKGGAPIKEVVSLKKLISESASFACRGSQVNCESSLPDNLWAVEADCGQISQVFHNLVINAIQAMPTGGMIKIRGENLEVTAGQELPLDIGRYVHISIQDQGIGISGEHLTRIFDPYFTTKQKGSGLGLATSYSIIRSHHGHIAVESELGRGTTFNVYLPASNGKVIQPPQEDRQVLPGKGKILVMDDEAMVRDVLGKMLLALGYEVKFAENGAEAIDFFSQSEASGAPFAAAILDLTIPGGMGGKEAMARLLKIDPQIKAIVSSGYSDDPIMADFQKYGFTAVIAKPYRISDLGNVLNKALTG